MFNIYNLENILSYIFIIAGIVIIILTLNGIICGVTIGNKGIAMRLIKKEENEKF